MLFAGAPRLLGVVSPCAWRCARRRGTPSPSRPPFWRPGGIGYLLLLLGARLREGAVYAAQARHRHNELHEHGANALSVAHWRANAMLDGPRGCGKRRPRKPQNRIVLLLRASDAHEAAEGRGGGLWRKHRRRVWLRRRCESKARWRRGAASEMAAMEAEKAERGRQSEKAACPAGCAAARGGDGAGALARASGRGAAAAWSMRRGLRGQRWGGGGADRQARV